MSNVRMPDVAFMIGANGMIADVSFNGLPSPGQTTFGLAPTIGTGETPNIGDTPSPGPFSVTQLLPGSVIQLNGGGEYDLISGMNALQGIGSGSPSSPVLGVGFRGSIQVDYVTGTAGSATPIVYLSSQVGLNAVPTEYIGIFVDATNRPTFTITDASGAIKAQGLPAGAAIPAGTPAQLRLFWDAAGTVLPGYVAFLINGTPVPLGTVTGPWTPFGPGAVYYGRGASVGGGNPFTGRFNKVQIGTSCIPTNSQIAPATSQTPP